MAAYGSKTPKRTSLWSNSRVISGFFTSRKIKRTGKQSGFKTTKRYVDHNGKKRFQGNKNLRKTGILGCFV